MSYIEGESHNQSLLFPEILDDYVTHANLVRFIDAFEVIIHSGRQDP
ncbi:MAG: hypothetical protein HYY46_01300 [Deltaproteobacteria bacterium]|nr:hypothetical protein [Deltaproteobacteria bacterium]